MALAPNATPLDQALDDAARILAAVSSDEVTYAARAMWLWERVFIEAIRSGELRVAVAAAGEWQHFKEIFRALIRAP